MSPIPPCTNSEDGEYELWEEMKHYSLSQLHSELISSEELRRWAAARELQVRGQAETFSYLITLSKMPDASFREIAAFALGQLGTPNRPFIKQSTPILIDLLKHDLDVRVRAAAASALGYLASPDSFEFLKNASLDKEADVRANVAFALGLLQDERSIQPLISLTRDNDNDVACWAVIGLRSLNINSPAISERFVEMLSDSRESIQDEIICCLAEWRDIRVLPALLKALQRKDINYDLLEAAGNLGELSLLPKLNDLLDEWKDDPPKILEQAIFKIKNHSKTR